MPVATEDCQIRDAFGNLEKIESVALTLDEDDDRRQRLLRVVRETLTALPPIRPQIAAGLLDLSERTVRMWAAEGLLARVETPTTRRILLDPTIVHDVMHLLREWREAAKTPGLLDAVYWRLTDAALLERGDLAESLAQMRRGESVPYEFATDDCAAEAVDTDTRA